MVGGCPAVVVQWQSTGGSSQRCPGFDSWRLPAFFNFLYFRLIISNFLLRGHYGINELLKVNLKLGKVRLA